MGSQKLQIYIHFSQAVREQKAHQTTTIAMLASRLLNPPKLRGLEQGTASQRPQATGGMSHKAD
jgi:hypothetical protein